MAGTKQGHAQSMVVRKEGPGVGSEVTDWGTHKQAWTWPSGRRRAPAEKSCPSWRGRVGMAEAARLWRPGRMKVGQAGHAY